VALDHAADGNDRLAMAGTLQRSGFYDCVDRFLLGGIDEAARIDEDDVSVVGGGRETPTAILQLGDLSLRIDGVLFATQRNQGELHR
jgi:hypothetical protein